MTLVALARAAMVLPREMTPKALGSSAGESAHPLVQNGGDYHVAIAVFLQVFFGQLFQGLNGRHVLNEVAALPVTHGDVLNALLSRQKGLNDGHGVRDAGRHQGARQGP